MCKVCKQTLEVFDGSSEIAYRLTVTPAKRAKKAIGSLQSDTQAS
jgi:hypothetical protein